MMFLKTDSHSGAWRFQQQMRCLSCVSSYQIIVFIALLYGQSGITCIPAYNRWTQRQQFCLHEAFGYHRLVKSSAKSAKKKSILYCMLTPFVSGQTDWLMELCLKTHALICKEVICDMLWGIHLQLFAFSIHFFCPVLTFKPCSGYGSLQFWGLAIWEVCFLLAK